MAGLTKPVKRNRHWAVALAGFGIGVLVMTMLLIQRLPVELTVTKSAVAAPSFASQPGLFDTLLAMHPILPAAQGAVIDAFSSFKASLLPEPPSVPHAVVVYEADDHGNFVPVR